ncbi:MAG: adenine phosphoribosyltransferase [Rhizobiales bacterium]|nr:adenine phosphoribosyltransferase [Hyphomicrobiales bacterium]
MAVDRVDLRALIRTIPDHPKPGIQFRDITTLIADPVGLRAAIDGLLLPFLTAGIDLVVGIEARGFILGGAVAHELGRGFVPIRKKGKLPWKTIGQEYSLEYGVDTIEIHEDAIPAGARVLLVDDLIATGGTADAAIELIRRSGGEIVAAAFIVDLPELGGAARLKAKDVDVHTLVSFEGH